MGTTVHARAALKRALFCASMLGGMLAAASAAAAPGCRPAARWRPARPRIGARRRRR